MGVQGIKERVEDPCVAPMLMDRVEDVDVLSPTVWWQLATAAIVTAVSNKTSLTVSDLAMNDTYLWHCCPFLTFLRHYGCR